MQDLPLDMIIDEVMITQPLWLPNGYLKTKARNMKVGEKIEGNE